MNRNQNGNSIAANVLLYGIGGILSQAAGLITLPMMVRSLTASEYGTIEVITSASGYFSLLIGLNTISGLYRFFNETDEASGERRTVVSTVMIFVFLCGLAIALGAILFSSALSFRLFGSGGNAALIRLAFLSMIPVSVYTYAMGLLRLQNKALPYIVISLVVSAAYMGSILYWVGFRRTGAPGFYVAQFTANLIGTILALAGSRRYLTFAFSPRWFRRIARYSFPLVPGSILAWSLSANNRLVLNAAAGEVQVAYYGLANKAAIVITLATQAFCNAWEPMMYALFREEDRLRRTLPKMLTLFTYGTLLIAAIMMTGAREIFLLLAPPEYLVGVGLLAVIQLRWLFTMGVYVVDPGTAKTGRTIWVTVMLAAAVAANLIANRILVPLFGLTGAVFAELIGYASAMIGRWIVSDRLFPIRWDRRFFILAIALYALCAGVQTRLVFSALDPALAFALRFAATSVFAGTLWTAQGADCRTECVELGKKGWARIRKWV